MKTIAVSGFVDKHGVLQSDHPLNIKNQRVKIIVLTEENVDDATWYTAMASNPAFDFLRDDAEDIYSLTDGTPILKQPV